MAEIAPFCATLFDPTKVTMSDVLAPPYDVVDAAGRAALLAKHPKNCARLILPEGADGYEQAAALQRQWLADGTLRRDDVPALYRYHQTFTSAELDGREVTRKGFIAAVRLHRFEERVLLPHERTLKGPKLDRLNLMRATGAHFSQIFTLYKDPKGEVEGAFGAAGQPMLDGTTDDGTRHRLWPVSDPAVTARVVELLADKQLYIADGHHRYETMVTYRDELEASAGSLAEDSAARFGTMFLSNMDDDGMIVLPTHRLVHSLASFDLTAFLDQASQHFTVERRTDLGSAQEVRDALASAGTTSSSFAVIAPSSDDVWLLSLRADFDAKKAGLEGAPEVTSLDVTLLHTLLLENLLGIDKAALEAQTNVSYIKGTQAALERGRSAEGQVCFLMNATPVDQVREVSDVGGFMPQKSTFFVPKIASGIVFRGIDAKRSVRE